MYFSAHNHTDYSNLRLLDSTNKVKELIDKAIDLGLSGLAITDHEVLSSHVKADKYRKELLEKGVIDEDFTIAFGDEIYLVDSLDKKQQYYHYILIAKDQKGYEQLKKISSQAWSNSYYDRGMERVPITYEQIEDIIGEEKGHLIGSTACLGGFLPNTLLKMYKGEVSQKQASRKVSKFIDWSIDVLGKDNFFFELQAGNTEEQSEVNKMVYQIGKSRGIKNIITTDSHYLSKEDRDIHRAFLHSQEGDREVDAFYKFTYMMSEAEIKNYMENDFSESELDEMLSNTNIIADKCSNIDLFQEVDITKIEVEDFKFTKEFKKKFKEYKYISLYLNSDNKQNRALINYTLQGLINKKDVEVNDKYLSRIDIELEHIKETSKKVGKSMSRYLLTARSLVSLMWEEGDSLVGPSRGSATGLLINYLIDIIQVNPVEWGIPWWRFIHKDRPDIMDIDLDSQKSQRGQILDALNKRFGKDKVLNIATFGTIGAKSSILSACRGLDIDDSEAHYLTGLVPDERGSNWPLKDVINGNEKKGRRPQPEFVSRLKEYEDKKLKEVILAFEGIVEKRSIHASGIYIYNEPYYKRNAMMMSPSSVPTTQFDMSDSDYMGGVKFDFLTVKILDKIRIAMEHLIDAGYIEQKSSLRETYDNCLHPAVLDYESPQLWEKASSGEVVSLFQFNTMVGSNAIKEVHPKDLKEMATANSLMRLVSDSDVQPLDKFIKYRKKIDLWYEEMFQNGLTEEESDIMKKHLSASYGIAATQEDLMEILMDENISDFTVVEAHKARKAIAKKKPKLIKQLKKDYFKRSKERANSSENLINYV
ncbi:MAG: PHP domain-containing protein [Halanaerobiales bacterium]|nr:PHP domain-containing protein [Halanaerobiales bacterium]